MGIPTHFLAVIGASAGSGRVYRTQKHQKPLSRYAQSCAQSSPSGRSAESKRFRPSARSASPADLRKHRLRALAVGATRPARLPSSVVLVSRRITLVPLRAILLATARAPVRCLGCLTGRLGPLENAPGRFPPLGFFLLRSSVLSPPKSRGRGRPCDGHKLAVADATIPSGQDAEAGILARARGLLAGANGTRHAFAAIIVEHPLGCVVRALRAAWPHRSNHDGKLAVRM